MSDLGRIHQSPIFEPLTQGASASGAGSISGHSVTLSRIADEPARSSGIGDKVKAFFNGIKHALQGMVGGIADALRKHEPILEVDRLADVIFGNDADATVEFRPELLAKSDRLAGSYAEVRRAADGMDASHIGGFMRGNTPGSKMTTFAGKTPEFKTIASNMLNQVAGKTIAVENNMYGYDRFKDTNDPQAASLAALRDPDADVREIARDTVARIDDVMCRAFGTPGDASSIRKAAARYPQSLCDHLAVLYRAVDASDADDGMKDAMKLHLARDALVLRPLNPVIIQVVADRTQGGGVADRSDQSKCYMQVTKAVQSLANGVGVGSKDTHPEVQKAGAHMKDRWNDAFLDFAHAVVARADRKTVDAAAQNGEMVVNVQVLKETADT